MLMRHPYCMYLLHTMLDMHCLHWFHNNQHLSIYNLMRHLNLQHYIYQRHRHFVLLMLNQQGSSNQLYMRHYMSQPFDQQFRIFPQYMFQYMHWLLD